MRYCQYQFLTGCLLLARSQDIDFPEHGTEVLDLQEDILLLQVDVKLSRGQGDASLVSEGFHTESDTSGSPALLSEGFRSELGGGAMFGPKTSAALFLLSSCTFGLLCLCGAKPFITAPRPVLNLKTSEAHQAGPCRL